MTKFTPTDEIIRAKAEFDATVTRIEEEKIARDSKNIQTEIAERREFEDALTETSGYIDIVKHHPVYPKREINEEQIIDKGIALAEAMNKRDAHVHSEKEANAYRSKHGIPDNTDGDIKEILTKLAVADEEIKNDQIRVLLDKEPSGLVDSRANEIAETIAKKFAIERNLIRDLEAKIMPCPFCGYGHSHPRLIDEENKSVLNAEKVLWKVTCDVCNASAGLHTTIENAFNVWQRRG